MTDIYENLKTISLLVSEPTKKTRFSLIIADSNLNLLLNIDNNFCLRVSKIQSVEVIYWFSVDIVWIIVNFQFQDLPSSLKKVD